MNKCIEKSHDVSIVSSGSMPGWILVVHFNFLQDLNFIEGSLHVVGRTLLNFNRYIGLVLEVFTEPDGRKMPPS